MYSIMRSVKEDPLVGNSVYLLENIFELAERAHAYSTHALRKYASRIAAGHIADGTEVRLENFKDSSGLKVSFEYWQVKGAPAPTYVESHVFKNPAHCVTLIREYGEHESTEKQVAERMGVISKPIIKTPYSGISVDVMADELDDLAVRFVNGAEKASEKHMGRPVTYKKPKKAPPTDRGNFKGYKRWER